MSETFDPDERFTVPERAEPEDVLRRLLGSDESEAAESERRTSRNPSIGVGCRR